MMNDDDDDSRWLTGLQRAFYSEAAVFIRIKDLIESAAVARFSAGYKSFRNTTLLKGQKSQSCP